MYICIYIYIYFLENTFIHVICICIYNISKEYLPSTGLQIIENRMVKTCRNL